ncbi:MAG: nitroreductase family protein, partial [Candidatus Pacebacteria bacterium]|nr:nitroreductase family protein [Candidatus Paceibacterota bacterium]
YIALGSIMNSLSSLRIDSCPMEGFDRNEYNKILALNTEKEAVAVALAIGHRSAEPSYKKLRFDDLFENR